MAKVSVGKCCKCGKDLKVKERAAKPLMRLTCTCGWVGYVGYNICEICEKKLIAINGEDPDSACPGQCNNELIRREEKRKSDNFIHTVSQLRDNYMNRGHEALNRDLNKSQHSDKWKCPNCKQVFQKNRELEALSAIGHVLAFGEKQHHCPNCGDAVDITALMAGDYDLKFNVAGSGEESAVAASPISTKKEAKSLPQGKKKWWHFW